MQSNKINVAILCGGAGTRFRPVTAEVPKIMADINSRPFLNILIESFISKGFEKIVLCTGYMSEYVEKFYRQSPLFPYLEFSVEKFPLGTAGAIKNAQSKITSDHFIVVNGDSYCEIDWNLFLNFHQSKHALISALLTIPDERDDIGNVLIDDFGNIYSFKEKAGKEAKSFTSAGVYIFDRKTFELIPENKQVSLEKDLFPNLIGKNFYGFPVKSKLIDIGTPDRYKKALKYFNNYV